jgi:hypothetical protein
MTRNKIKTASKNIVLKTTMALVAVILVCITVYISGIKNHYQSEIEIFQQKYDILRDKAEAIEKLKSLRVDFFAKQSFLNYPGLSGYAMANFIRKISLISPQNLYLLEVNLQPGDQNITFLIKGVVYGNSEKMNRQILAAFFRKLSVLDDIIQFFPSPPEPVGKSRGNIRFLAKGEMEVE